MVLSLEASLKKLRTTYVDIFYVHWWDYETSIEEVMNGLHNLVVQGKVLYLVRGLVQLRHRLSSGSSSRRRRAFQTPPLGLYQKLTPTRVSLERHHLSSIRARGV